MPRKKKESENLDLEIYTKAGKLRKRKQKQTRNYFNQETEDSIVEYQISTDPVRRNYLFNTYIQHSLFKLAENIINTFKFYYTEGINLNDLIHEVNVFLLDKFHRYDQTQGAAYSYFGTIAKRYLIQYNNNNYKKLKLKAQLDEVDEDKKVYSDIMHSNDDIELYEFVESFTNYVEINMSSLFIIDKDREIVVAILNIFKQRESLDILNKQHLYLILRDITQQTTPNITRVINVFKTVFKEQLKLYYLEGALVTDLYWYL